MDDARRFLRYVMPGLVYTVQTILWLYLVFPERTYRQIIDFAGGDSLGAILGSFLASGALGYIFATVHHQWRWWREDGILDHTSLVTRLIRTNRIRKQLPEDRKEQRQSAEIISFGLWYSRIASTYQPIGEIVDKKLIALGDSAHGLGACRFASIFALLTTFVVAFRVGPCQFEWSTLVWFVIVLVLSICTILVFQAGYRRVAAIAQGIYEEVLEGTLAARLEPRASEAEAKNG